jgi:hypothetical protein
LGVRISWLAPDLITAARAALRARGEDWSVHFSPGFESPPPPDGIVVRDWEHVAEHVARAERVTAVVVDQGLEEALRQFAASPFAIEVATLAAAAHHVEQLSFELVELVLACEVDDLVFYAPFLRLLVDLGGEDHDRLISVYEAFCRAYAARQSPEPGWRERVDAVRDGLAGVYVIAGRHDQGHELFERRHFEDTGDVAVALSASRSFLAAGALGRAIHWLDVAIGRARGLGRADLASVLIDKQAALRRRLS